MKLVRTVRLKTRGTEGPCKSFGRPWGGLRGRVRAAPKRAADPLRLGSLVVKNAKSIGGSVLETPKRQLEMPFRLRETPKYQRFGARNDV